MCRDRHGRGERVAGACVFGTEGLVRVVLKYGWRVLVSLVLLTALSWASLRIQTSGGTLGDPVGGPGTFVLLIALREVLTVSALLWPTLRSRWSGTQLTCALFVAYFGVHSFVTLSRAMLTLPAIITSPVAAALSAHGFLVALASAVVMVVVMGRMHQQPFVVESPRLHLPAGEWLWKLALCALAGMGLWLAGQVLAPADVREFYKGAGQPSLAERAVLELGRGLLLVAFLLPIIKMMRGGRWETAVAVGLLAAVLGGVTPVILPTALLPAPVRIAFILGTAPGNLLYGGLVGYLFSRRPGIDSGSRYAGPDAWGVGRAGF
jgi:hypothetical protein